MTAQFIPYCENKKLTVVNFFAGPGCGKSTTAAGLFYKMKISNYDVELVHEIAKDCVWERRDIMFSEQDWLFAQQHRLIRRLVGHDIKYAITDSPILLGLFYMPPDFPVSLATFIEDAFRSYTNINILLTRNPTLPYVQAGRNETKEKAQAIDEIIKRYFDDNGIPYFTVTSGPWSVEKCFDIVQMYGNKYDV